MLKYSETFPAGHVENAESLIVSFALFLKGGCQFTGLRNFYVLCGCGTDASPGYGNGAAFVQSYPL